MALLTRCAHPDIWWWFSISLWITSICLIWYKFCSEGGGGGVLFQKFSICILLQNQAGHLFNFLNVWDDSFSFSVMNKCYLSKFHSHTAVLIHWFASNCNCYKSKQKFIWKGTFDLFRQIKQLKLDTVRAIKVNNTSSLNNNSLLSLCSNWLEGKSQHFVIAPLLAFDPPFDGILLVQCLKRVRITAPVRIKYNIIHKKRPWECPPHLSCTEPAALPHNIKKKVHCLFGSLKFSFLKRCFPWVQDKY